MINCTHNYVAALPCGCGVGIVVDDPQYLKDTANDVSAWITRGLHVQRLERAAAIHAFMAHCDNYPHEDWQRRHEAARMAREERARLGPEVIG